MKTRVFNILIALLGVAAAFGYKLNLTPEQLSTLAGLVVAIAAAVNQIVHEVQRVEPAPPLVAGTVTTGIPTVKPTP